jgi:membrane dipeptidase
LVDLHTDALYEHIKGAKDITKRTSIGHLDIPRMKEAGVSGQVFAIWTNPEKMKPGERAPFVFQAIDAFEDICRLCPADIALARTPDEMLAANSSGRAAGILGVEGGHALEGNLANLDRFHERGVRLLTITWNNANEFAGSCMERSDAGLTDLGRQAVRRMNELGMIVDLSHSSPRTFYDTLEASTAPVICSHSACKALRDFPRNLDDDQLRALEQKKGIVGIVFLPYFLGPEEGKADIDDVLNHIEHAVEVAGIDSVALGSDFDGFGKPPKGLEDVTRLPALLDGLRSRGYSEPDVAKVSGLNFLRLWREVSRP